MKITLLATLLFGLVFAIAVSAEERTLTPQQKQMGACNSEAAAQSLKGDERKNFMSRCLKKENQTTSGKPLTAQQQKMGACNKEASSKALKGDERRDFMGACLKR